MISFFTESKKIQDKLIEYRRYLHMHPEIDRDLKNTADFIESILSNYNISYKRYENCGIVAEVGKGEKIIALRADMDALTIEDKKNVPYKSKNKGLMHACGHDAHTSIQLGTCILLKKYEHLLNGKVRFIFQPAEETDGGAKDMIDYGALDNVSFISALHVEETLDTGTIGINSGIVSAASNPFKITIKGKGAHGAHPEDGIDPIVAASKIIDNLQIIISREISALKSAVITIGKINGGTAPNAIAEEVIIEGIIRTLGNTTRKQVLDRFTSIINLTAEAFRCNVEMNIIEGYPSFSNDNNLIEILNNIQSENSNYFTIKKLEYPSMGVEDFAYYTEKVPGIYFKLGCRNVNKGIVHPAHGSYFDIDEECLWIGCAIQCSIVQKFIMNETKGL